MMISARYGVPVLALLCLALVPTLIHGYLGLTIDDGRDAAAVGWTLAGLRGTPTSRSAASVRGNFQSDDWIEGQFTGAEGQVTVFVARSFDSKRLYHHPENSALHGRIFESRGTRPLPQMSDVPVHVLGSPGEEVGLAAYALLYDGRFIDNPYLFQARVWWELLIGGRKPMTLFLVHDASTPPDVPFESSLAMRVLREAIQRFLAQRPSSAS